MFQIEDETVFLFYIPVYLSSTVYIYLVVAVVVVVTVLGCCTELKREILIQFKRIPKVYITFSLFFRFVDIFCVAVVVLSMQHLFIFSWLEHQEHSLVEWTWHVSNIGTISWGRYFENLPLEEVKCRPFTRECTTSSGCLIRDRVESFSIILESSKIPPDTQISIWSHHKKFCQNIKGGIRFDLTWFYLTWLKQCI